MKPCARVGIELGWRCNCRCAHCFYRFDGRLGANLEKPLVDLVREMGAAAGRGCTHAVAVGQGEPSLYSQVEEWLVAAHGLGLKTSMITNGGTGLQRFKRYYEIGIDHLHLSVHDLTGQIATHLQVDRQIELIEWLAANDLPWRMNITIQRGNYRDLEGVVEFCLERGCRHVVLLGFLPHYEWAARPELKDLAVGPGECRSHVERAARLALTFNRLLTIRYFPFCHLDPDLWKFVVNARYVLYDPWEWDYGRHGLPAPEFHRAAVELGEQVAVQGKPCSECALRVHCGGWNRTYQAATGTELRPATSEINQEPGFYHDQNPANGCEGDFS